MICSYDECGKPAVARGLCQGHYVQWRRGAELTHLRPKNPTQMCAFSGCRNDNSKGSKGLCGAHYIQMKTGVPLHPLRDFGAKLTWINANAAFDDDECLQWPFSVNPNGRGAVKFRGRNMTAPKAMCIAANGPPPTEAHQAAHSCGKGHLGCMNPKHLQWATVKENAADRLAHGTERQGERHHAALLTASDVIAIRLAASSVTRKELAARYHVSYGTIIDVVNYRSWRHI